MTFWGRRKRRILNEWEQRLGPTGLEEFLRYQRIQQRALLCSPFGWAFVLVGAALPNIPALCVGIVILLVVVGVMFGPVWRGQSRTQRAAAQFQQLDTSHAFMLSLKGLEQFDAGLNRARRIEGHLRELRRRS
jgi:hypothetical protein